MADFKSQTLRPTIGMFDTLSTPEEVGWGNWRVVKNASTRSTKNRRRSGGWRRYGADAEDYNNQDLHDQLTYRQYFYDSYSRDIHQGGDLAGYSYPYFAPSHLQAPYSVFPPVDGPFCGYINDYPGGMFEDCPIFYPSIGAPYNYGVGFVSRNNLVSHWQMDLITAFGMVTDVQGAHDLTKFGSISVVAGKLGGALQLDTSGKYLLQADANYQTGDVKFAITGWVNMIATTAGDQHICGRWQQTGNQREYRVVITSGGQIRFDVSNNGTAVVSATHTQVLTPGTWYFFAAWHDSVSNTINIRVNAQSVVSTSHTTGVFVGTALYFGVGYNETTAANTLNGAVDELSFWKNGYPVPIELEALYNNGNGFTWPFDATDICNMGYPWYYLFSYFYTSCPLEYPSVILPGYPYGNRFPVYDPVMNYTYTYCGSYLHGRQGCREAITLLDDITTSGGRRLIASTASRVYELNQSSGNWRILADGLGSPLYSAAQCGCGSEVRGMSATMGAYLLYTNNFDYPMFYISGSGADTCDLNALQPIADLVALGISRAGGVVTWKGFTFFYDITEDGVESGGTVIWSDLNEPESYIESDTSFAGRAILAVGETILNAAELANWLIFYTNKRIIRVTLVGGEDVFNFEDVYVSDEEGSDALAYKFSLVNCGKMHWYLGKNDVFVFTQFDAAPQNFGWVTKAAGIIFNGIEEDDATYDKINEAACLWVTGGWNDTTKEVWLSWPTGENRCPDVTLRFNTKYNTADLIDDGFTAFRGHRPDERPTVGQWMEDLGICPRGTKVATGPKDGSVCAVGEPISAPLFLRNETEDPNLPVQAGSLCERLAGATLDDYCRDCPTTAAFIMASARDLTLKQSEDDYYYREMFTSAGDPEGCGSGRYVHEGYDTVMQMGLEAFRSDDEKMCKRVTIKGKALPQAIPSDLVCELGCAAQSDCVRWASSESRPFECLTDFTVAEHEANNTRADKVFDYSFWRRGNYIAARLRISGVGGGGDFAAMVLLVAPWGQAETP